MSGIKLETQIEIELKHILIELEYGRTNHFRHFIDQYFCYKQGYVTKNNKASWSEIVGNEFTSAAARKVLDDPNRSNKELIDKEHVVPLKVLEEMLLKINNPTTKIIDDFLSQWLLFATITKEEDNLLTKNGLKSAMPQGFNESDSKFSRYDFINLTVKK
ncbi:MAG: hypothetical protein COA44_13250 [Arcobacter sp.]|nr:MAG: hypothetical protein COA44_13250 [Arcobacter sp.]